MSEEDFSTASAAQQATRLAVLAADALAAWGVSGCTPALIKYRENAVFKVHTANGAPAVMRVHRQHYHDDASLASELEWMAMLGDAGITVPRPVPTLSGETMIRRHHPRVPGEWQVDMLSWLDGAPLGAVGEPLALPDPDSVFFRLGETVARMHSLSCDWSRQAQMARHAWDASGLVGDDPFWGRFWELAALSAPLRDLLERVRPALHDDLLAYGKDPQRYGLIHADLVPENVLLQDGAVQIIDFDDAGFGWHMFELVTIMHWLEDEPQYAHMKSSLLSGYQRVRSLTERDLATWNLFSAARSLTYLGWVHTRRSSAEAAQMTPMMMDMAETHCSRYLDTRHA